jgi:hypothetical protein
LLTELLEEHEVQLSAVEFKWKEKKVKKPVAFDKAYPEVPFTLINSASYINFIV